MHQQHVDFFEFQFRSTENLFDHARDSAHREIDQAGPIHVKITFPALAVSGWDDAGLITKTTLPCNQCVRATTVRSKFKHRQRLLSGSFN